MPISLAETIITLTAAARTLPVPPHPSTIWRWYRRGVRGIRLETIVIAGRRFTSLEALERFIRDTNAAASDGPATLDHADHRIFPQQVGPKHGERDTESCPHEIGEETPIAAAPVKRRRVDRNDYKAELDREVGT